MDRGKPDGYYIPFHQSLTNTILMLGVDRNFCIGFWSIAVAIGVMMQMYWFLPVAFVVHMFMREATKTDDIFFKVVINHIQSKKVFW